MALYKGTIAFQFHFRLESKTFHPDIREVFRKNKLLKNQKCKEKSLSMIRIYVILKIGSLYSLRKGYYVKSTKGKAQKETVKKKKLKRGTIGEAKTSEPKEQEDAAMKIAAQYFGDVLLPRFGIKGKVVGYGPTELVHLELKKLYQDFIFIMEDGRWIHFEFQSTNEGRKGLKRFRVYEAVTSYLYGVEVTTYVLYSGKIQNPMTEFTEGLNTYRVYPIIMQHEDADEMIANLEAKLKNGELITREDLVSLMLCPLMSGESSQKDRIANAYRITQKADGVSEEEIQKAQAVIYAMADKFLDKADMQTLREEVKMTRLGQMIYDDGKSEGIDLGIGQGISMVISSLIKACRDFGVQKEDVISRIVRDFSYTKEQAEADVEKYW